MPPLKETAKANSDQADVARNIMPRPHNGNDRDEGESTIGTALDPGTSTAAQLETANTPRNFAEVVVPPLLGLAAAQEMMSQADDADVGENIRPRPQQPKPKMTTRKIFSARNFARPPRE